MSTSEIAKLESRWRDNPQGLTFAPLAEAHRKQKDPRRALEILQPGLERHPDYIPANIVLGRCHWDLGDLEAAEKAFSHVLALDGENVIALKALADITERQSRPHEAERWLETLLSVDRSNDEARDQLTRIRAVQSLLPPVETPSGLGDEDQPVDASIAAADDMAAPVATEPSTVGDAQPAGVSAADDMSDLEPAAFPELTPSSVTSEPPRSEPEPVATLPADVEPVPPPPPPPLAATEAFGFERAEEIVLNVSTGSEFQVPSAADELIARASDAPESLLEEPARGDLTPPTGFQPPSPATLFGSYVPDESTAEHEPPADVSPAYEPPAAHPLLAGEPASPEPPYTDAPDGAEPDPVVTETMAQVFLRQGHIVEALAVYRELLARSPGSARLRERVTELEERQRVLSAPPPRPSFLARDTGGQSLGTFFEALLAARPELARPAADDGAGGVELNPDTAPATRPAQEPLSLGSVFGEDPPAITPAVPPAGSAPAEAAPASGADAVSFDDFFAGAQVPAPAPAQPARPPRAKPEDDLDQFHSWLQGLKR